MPKNAVREGSTIGQSQVWNTNKQCVMLVHVCYMAVCVHVMVDLARGTKLPLDSHSLTYLQYFEKKCRNKTIKNYCELVIQNSYTTSPAMINTNFSKLHTFIFSMEYDKYIDLEFNM